MSLNSFYSIGQNLVPNPSLELNDSCPQSCCFTVGNQPLYWRAWKSSPDYFHGCAEIDPFSSVSVPYNVAGFQHAQESEAYAGLVAYSEFNNYREYIGVSLLEPLEVGHRYQVSFWTNLAYGGQVEITTSGCNNVGALFTNLNEEQFAPPGPIEFRNYAHVYSTEVLLDTVSWTLVEGSFVADSAYQYLVIGNFFENDLTEHVPVVSSFQEVAYVYIDNVHVTEDDSTVGMPYEDVTQFCLVDNDNGSVVIRWPHELGLGVRILDSGGRLVWSRSAVQDEVIVQTSNWPSGLYCGVLQGEGRTAFVKFMVR
ncbi:MAG: hypothetical protein IPI00_11265 [Flavobacteriales bacterium]|nr:hypothetical protein [Flavobacteriales bacterium]MBK9536084.1 hypothetical protein [Flavobacteriales bacterium]MBP9139517.1 hypothetical protein [Flavobacteriales bacterium]HQX30346.1 hypothetical protein [Flavobacteriales bacterium]HQX38908.1 hypothetical protein [Flavobacteriales bacterium]